MYFYISPSSQDLYHHGVRGQKWGIRRYQNPDGSLTPEGMKRYGVDSKGRQSEKGRKQAISDYRELVKQANDELNKQNTVMYINAYNKFADDANKPGGIIDRYNAEHSPDDEDYDSGMEDIMDTEIITNVAQMSLEFLENNYNWKDAERLVERFGLESYEESVKQNRETIETLRNAVENRKRW